MIAIVKDFTATADPGHVWGALTQSDKIGHWWTNDLNITPEVGSLAEFRFGEWGDFVLRFEIAELSQDRKVHWIYRFGSLEKWAGTSITLQLEPIHGGTRVVFTHKGFVKKDEIYEQTRGNWNYFLASLKSYLETGKGTPGAPPDEKCMLFALPANRAVHLCSGQQLQSLHPGTSFQKDQVFSARRTTRL